MVRSLDEKGKMTNAKHHEFFQLSTFYCLTMLWKLTDKFNRQVVLSIEGLVSSEVGGKYQMWVFTTNEYVLFCLMKAGRIESNQCGPFSGYLSSRVWWRLKGRRVRRGTILATRLNAIMGLSSPRPPGCWGDSWRQRRGTRPVRWA